MNDLLPPNTQFITKLPGSRTVVGPDEFEPLFFDQEAWSRFRCIMSSWLGTPYRHATMVKGRGADCTLFIGACWKEFGVLKDICWDYYPADWHIQTHEEYVLEGLHLHFTEHANPNYIIHRLPPDTTLMQGDVIAFALTPTKVSNHTSIYLGATERGKLMLHSVQSKGVSLFPLAGYFERHKSNIFRILRKV